MVKQSGAKVNLASPMHLKTGFSRDRRLRSSYKRPNLGSHMSSGGDLSMINFNPVPEVEVNGGLNISGSLAGLGGLIANEP